MPTFLRELFADGLMGRPSFAAWCRQREANAFESLRIAEIGHVERSNSVTPDVSWKLPHRWYAPLGKVAIPLSPQRLLLVGEVEGVNDLAALPSIVARRLRPGKWVSAVRNLT